MPNSPTTLYFGAEVLLLLPALLWAAVALAAGPRADGPARWRRAMRAAAVALASSLIATLAWAVQGAGFSPWLRLDAVGSVMAILVAFIGAVIVRYSRHYLDGEPGQARYVRWLAATLAAVSLVVASNNLLLLVAGWMAASFSMLRLLTFYGDRPAAVIAAHKKFITARLADLCMSIAVLLLYLSFGTLRLDELAAAARGGLPAAAQAAVVLVAVAALLKCAQLPLHGWLIQVMEAPTPVSALLHAGVVNLGGFVLLRLAPLVDATVAAQGLLVVVGTASAALAALVATTRISVKVALAWSTCAQMGFMLVQCGLGLWPMALLHLVAHSLYKAHAFLAAGGVVQRALVERLAPPLPPAAPWTAVGVAVAAVATVVAVGWAFGIQPQQQPALVTMASVFALALVPLLRSQMSRTMLPWTLAGITAAAALAALWFGLHGLLSVLVPATGGQAPMWPVVALGFAALFVVQAIVTAQPQGALARRLHPWCYGGFYLDERLHRLLFRLLPLPALARPASNTVSL